MTRKLLIIGVALIGFTLALGSNAWAEDGKRGKRHKNDRRYHQSYKTPPGHHYGWEKGKRNSHKSRYRHFPAYRLRDPHRRPVVEKHVYHHYRSPSEDLQNNSGLNVTFSVIDNVLSIAVAVNGMH